MGRLARIGENSLTIAWVQHSLSERCASYRFALEHLAIAEPERQAGDVDLNLTQLQQRIANYNLLAPAPRFAAVPVALAAPPAVTPNRFTRSVRCDIARRRALGAPSA